LTGAGMAYPWISRHRYMKCPLKGQNKTTPQGGFQNLLQSTFNLHY